MSAFDYLQMTLVTDDETVFLKQVESLTALVDHAQAWVGDEFRWAIARDEDGHDSLRFCDTMLLGDPSLNGCDSMSAEFHPRAAVEWQPPVLSIGTSGPNRGSYPYEVSWSVLASSVDEALYCQVAAMQVGLLRDVAAFVAGFAGPSPWPGSADLNSPVFQLMEVSSAAVDLSRSLAGVHWLNIVPSAVLTGNQVAELRSLGAAVDVGPTSTVFQLADRPSDLTDESVDRVMKALTDSIYDKARNLPSNWWRLSYDQGGDHLP